MKRVAYYLVLLGAVSACSVIIGGCSAGWLTGTVYTCNGLRCGDFVRLTGYDDAVHTGVFCETKKMEFADYVEHVKRVTMNGEKPSGLPAPGERIKFTTVLDPEHVWSGFMIGFCSNYMWVKLHGDDEISRFYVSGVTRLVGVDGKIIFRDELRAKIASNEVPLMSVVVIKSGVDSLSFAMNDIKSIEVVTPRVLASD